MKKCYPIWIYFLTLSVSGLLCACGNEKETAGGITDIDHSIAGKILDVAGNPVSRARVVAYIDNSIAVEDSVSTVTDESGNYRLTFDRDVTADTVMLYAEYDSLCALENFGTIEKVEGSKSFDLQVSPRKSVTGNIQGVTSGYMRIKGTPLSAKIAEDGSFEFGVAPAGNHVLLQLVQDSLAVAVYKVSTADSSRNVVLPPLIQVHLQMDGLEAVYENDSTLAQDVDYVEGISGKAVALKPGQFIDLGTLDPTGGDFTISLWTKWNGPNGQHQILVSQRAYWSDSTSRFQWHFESNGGMFTVMKSQPAVPEAIAFGDSSAVPIGEWCQLTLVSKDHLVSMYVDGKQVGESSYFIPNSLDRAVPLRIGGNEISTETWNGIIDEVRIENIARDPNTIQTHFYNLEKFKTL